MKRIVPFAMLIMVRMTIIALAEPIVEAAKNGDFQTVKTILTQNPSKLDATDGDNYTALHWACIRSLGCR
jgi:ankyrin repeat protein